MKNFKERFSIQFSSTDPQHIQAVEILNRQNVRSKAQYLVNAILHYESCSKSPNFNMNSQLDTKAVEAIVNRVLLEKESTLPAPCKVTNDEKITHVPIDEDGLSAIAQSLGSFRNKKP